MSVSIQTPPSSGVFSSYNNRLSPPPTPVAKRGHHFFNSNDDTMPPEIPMFFPSSNSVMTGHLSCLKEDEGGIKEEEEENVERRLLKLLASRPTPTIRLKPRPTSSIHNILDTDIPPEDTRKKQILIVDNQIMPPPIYSPSSIIEPKRSIESMIRKLPSLSSDSETKTISKSDTRKLPSFQRGGLHRHTTKRRNSIVARSA